MSASYRDFMPVVQCLLNRGADVNATTQVCVCLVDAWTISITFRVAGT